MLSLAKPLSSLCISLKTLSLRLHSVECTHVVAIASYSVGSASRLRGLVETRFSVRRVRRYGLHPTVPACLPPSTESDPRTTVYEAQRLYNPVEDLVLAITDTCGLEGGRHIPAGAFRSVVEQSIDLQTVGYEIADYECVQKDTEPNRSVVTEPDEPPEAYPISLGVGVPCSASILVPSNKTTRRLICVPCEEICFWTRIPRRQRRRNCRFRQEK